jgi:hypothetical protein
VVVDINDTDAVVRYTREHASMGLEHVTALVRGERDAMMMLINDLTQDEADTRIDSGAEYSVSMILQHLNMSFERSIRRIRSLSEGQPHILTGAGGVGGALPEQLDANFDNVRQRFLEGEDAVLDLLEATDPNTKSDVTAPHAVYGPFTWLEWATYSHHVHTSDHVAQVRRIKGVLRSA